MLQVQNAMAANVVKKPSLEPTPVPRGKADREVIILGIRGLPAAHGGFETFAERLAIWLKDRGWKVTVYCQGSDRGTRYEDMWEGVRRIHIPTHLTGVSETIEFDMKSAFDSVFQDGKLLTLGYNTGFLCAALRILGKKNFINMDGFEWKRTKYNLFSRAYLWMNERIAMGFANHLIADHPEIAKYLIKGSKKKKVTMIPYGGLEVADGDLSILEHLQLEPDKFFTLIARPERENQILEIVKAYSSKPRGAKLVILGRYGQNHPYQAEVLNAAGSEIVFPGPIYDKSALAALRFHCVAYLHGHQVGGTNPSLVEAMGAGNAIIAHDNSFNRWVAGDAALYFSNAQECSDAIDKVLTQEHVKEKLKSVSRSRWSESFTWPIILKQYEDMLLDK
jgi:glycosyltransferase involved in cell wall biosynthesis